MKTRYSEDNKNLYDKQVDKDEKRIQEDEFFNILYEIADTVIELKETSYEKIRKEKVFNSSNKLVVDLFLDFNKKLSLLEEENEKIFIKEVYLNFLLFSLKKLIVQYDVPDDNIIWLADHIKEQIVECTRESYEKRKRNDIF